jgi:predicted RNase H-like HicB family nuclease
MEFHLDVREEDGSYWGEVRELPGCFASGSTLDELKEAVVEAIGLYPAEGDAAPPSGSVDEMRLLVESV